MDTRGQVPYNDMDDTRRWAETFRVDGKLKPNVVLRIATDTNYIMNQSTSLSGYPGPVSTNSVLNLAMPGMRLPHVVNWSVNETCDNPVSTGSFEILNCLQVSSIEATLTSNIPKEIHNLTVNTTYIENSLGVIEKYVGNTYPMSHTDQNGIYYRQEKIKYRTFEPQTFTVDTAIKFPDPATPDDADGSDIKEHPAYTGYVTANGVGNYFVQIDEEIIRVSRLQGNTFTILPGGRQQGQLLQAHTAGTNTKVKLLGFGPRSGEWAGYGYLSLDDFKPYKNLLRPGTCIVSYEGYGKFPKTLDHDVNPGRNYVFTGYWFVKGLEESLGEDGVPKVRVDLVSAGELLNKQKITPDILLRCKTQYGQWRVGQEQQTIWGAAEHNRNIPGDWVDYHSWDPMLKDSYPLQIKTEYAQHKEFLQHMRESKLGKECLICRQELKEWLSEHQGRDPIVLADQYDAMPNGAAKDKLGQEIESLKLLQTRAIGRHIYKQSIRVLREAAGPIKTYIRLMATLATAAWDHPAYGTELAQMFTKIPNQLFENMRDIYTGLIYNGQVDFTRFGYGESDYDWVRAYDDNGLTSRRSSVVCPFESTYDKAPFYQPMQDLADVNGNVFWVSRDGKPTFMPRSYPLRPLGLFSKEKYEWFMSYGGSISAYSHSINTDAIITQCWVTGTTAFDSQYTVPAGGTGLTASGARVVYSPMAGNKEGLALTAGVQQIETISLDNQALGLSWDTKVENWGKIEVRKGVESEIDGYPPLYDGSPVLKRGSNNKAAVRRLQQTINFFLIRRYLPAIVYGGNNNDPADDSHYKLDVDGKYGFLVEHALTILQNYIKNTTPSDKTPAYQLGYKYSNTTRLQQEIDGKYYGRDTFLWIWNWLNIDDFQVTDANGKTVTVKNNNYIKNDIWWYAHNGLTWEEYVGALTGIKIPMKPSGIKKKIPSTSRQSIETPLYVPDDKGLQEAVAEWHKTFTKSLVNVGNRTVDDSINKATVRSISTNLADPRIQPGDILWPEIPGHLSQSNIFGKLKPPFTNGIYVTSLSRQMDLQNGTYSASYSGYRYRGDFGSDDRGASIGSGFDFIKEENK